MAGLRHVRPARDLVPRREASAAWPLDGPSGGVTWQTNPTGETGETGETGKRPCS
jgi:hypothetical protein